MKKLNFLLLFLIVFTLNIFAQSDYRIVGRFGDNDKLININEILFLNDTCVFSIVDALGYNQQMQVYEWKFKIECDEEEYFFKCSPTSSHFGIKIDSVLYNDNELCSQFKRYQFENNRSIYYRATVQCKGSIPETDTYVDLQFPILLNLLPEIPQITIKDIEWGTVEPGITEGTYWFDNAYINIQIDAKRADNIYVYKLNKPRIITQIDKNIGRLEFIDVDDTFAFLASNKNGSTSFSADTISIPQLITELKIPKDVSTIFYPNPVIDFLYISRNPENITSLSITSLKGEQLLYLDKVPSAINLTHFSSGTYLLSYELKQTKEKKKMKLIKK